MTHYADQVKRDLLDWMEAIRYPDEGFGRWPYHAAMERPWSLQASSIAVSIFDELGELASLPAPTRQAAAAVLLACQDPEDGLFKDPLETEAVHIGGHPWPEVWGQRNGAALEALERLGVEPKYPVNRSLFGNLAEVDPAAWTLEAFTWENPWRDGERWARAVRAYVAHRDPATPAAADPRLITTFEAVETHVFDPDTGTPSRRMPDAKPAVAMAGLFKAMMAYLCVGRPIPHAQAGIDSTLALQHDDGDWGQGDNMCMVWDSLWVLRYLDLQLEGGHRHSDIVQAGDRTARFLMQTHRKADGGFSFHRDRCQTNHHSIRLCGKPHPISDMLGTMMALKCLIYVDEWFAGR